MRSEHSSTKKSSAKLLGYFFADWPELQEKVLDAVYDLCEDAESEASYMGSS